MKRVRHNSNMNLKFEELGTLLDGNWWARL